MLFDIVDVQLDFMIFSNAEILRIWIVKQDKWWLYKKKKSIICQFYEKMLTFLICNSKQSFIWKIVNVFCLKW